MKTVTIHNFRSIKHQTFDLLSYSLLVGANNSGKTNIIDALRIFYEKEKYDKEDFPKFKTDDQESWIEIEFNLIDEEFINLKDDYKQQQNALKVRKYLKSSQSELVKSNQSNIYGYEKGKLSKNLFYGAKNISEAKLGDVIYIPEVAKVDEYTKLSGPSAFRDTLNFLVKKVIKNSQSFGTLSQSFIEFNEKFKTEASKDGISIQNFIDDVNKEIENWDVSFGVNINEIKPEDIIKNLVSHFLKDKHLGEQEMSIDSFGQGLQRHLIYTLIRLSTKYKEMPFKKEKKEFSPDFTIILFEEPEAFLHPSQQEILNLNLESLSIETNQQVLVSTHSTHFVSKNINNLSSILKLYKKNGETQVYQITAEELNNTLLANSELKSILGKKSETNDLELEAIRYSLWLDPDRCCAFFADLVLICEGASEKVLLDYLIRNNEIELPNKEVYILSAAGKENVHRYMNLFKELGIKHSIIFDGDENKKNKDYHTKLKEFLEKNKNDFTVKIDCFQDNLEKFLDIPEENDNYKKPLSVMWHYQNKKIDDGKIKTFKGKIANLLS
jgi:predicted ATP-dependent endonuclease of OLD family